MKIIQHIPSGFMAEILFEEMRQLRAIEHKSQAPETIEVGTEIQMSSLIDSIQKNAIENYNKQRAEPTEEEKRAARKKALATFNNDKAERLGEINKKGISFREQKELLAGEIDALKKEREIVTLSISESEAKLKNVTEDRDRLKIHSEDFSEVPNRVDLLDEIEDLETQIKAERDGKVQDVDKVKGEITTLQSALNEARLKVDMFVRREQGEKRIEELKVDEKKLSAEYEKLEEEIYLIEQFIRTKVSLLTTRINEKFETVRFKLFDEQVNGALAECCQITVNGIPFDKGLNNGARINAGLEIVRVLQEHYKLKAPVFADNAEAVNNLVDVGCQTIRLYVSEDKQLRVEFAEGVKRAKTR